MFNSSTIEVAQDKFDVRCQDFDADHETNPNLEYHVIHKLRHLLESEEISNLTCGKDINETQLRGKGTFKMFFETNVYSFVISDSDLY